jgi:hypothetical protein
MIPVIYLLYVYLTLTALLALFFFFTVRLLIATGTFTFVATTVTGLVVAMIGAVITNTLVSASLIDWTGNFSFLSFFSF